MLNLPTFPLPDLKRLVTAYDIDDDAYADAQYHKGLSTGKNAQIIYISYSGSWSAKMKDGSLMSAYERIGYHRSTRELLKGFIDSGVQIVNYCEFLYLK